MYPVCALLMRLNLVLHEEQEPNLRSCEKAGEQILFLCCRFPSPHPPIGFLLIDVCSLWFVLAVTPGITLHSAICNNQEEIKNIYPLIIASNC